MSLKTTKQNNALALEKGVDGAGSAPAITGTSIATIHFSDNSGVHNVWLHWQQPDRTIVQARYNETTGWERTLTTVALNAATNTSIAACVNPNGSNLRVFYLDNSHHLADVVLQPGGKEFSDGGLSSSQLATSNLVWSKLAALRRGDGTVQLFFQTDENHGRIQSATCDFKGQWQKTPNGPKTAMAAPATGLAAAITKADADPAKEAVSLFLQDGKTTQLLELRSQGDGDWNAVAVLPYALPVGAGICVFHDGVSLAVAALTRSNTVVVSYFNTSKNTWGAPSTIFSKGTRSSGLAVQAWPEGKGDAAVKRLYLQVEGGGTDVREVQWNAGTKQWASLAIPLTPGQTNKEG